MSAVVGRPSRMTGIGPEVLQSVQNWSGGTPACPGVVGSPSRMFASVREPSQMSGIGPEVLQDVQEWSGDPPG